MYSPPRRIGGTLRSELFAGDPLLEAIAADQERISRFRHPTDPAVRRLQTALLLGSGVPAGRGRDGSAPAPGELAAVMGRLLAP